VGEWQWPETLTATRLRRMDCKCWPGCTSHRFETEAATVLATDAVREALAAAPRGRLVAHTGPPAEEPDA
jgi:hypothetical protein